MAIRHRRQLAREQRKLTKMKVIRQRTSFLMKELGLFDPSVISPLDVKLEQMSKEISDFEQSDRPATVSPKSVEALKSLPSLLIFARQELGWTQNTLAEKTNLTRRQIGTYERNGYASIRFDNLVSIAQTLMNAASSR